MAVLLMAQAPHNNSTTKNKDGGSPIFHEFFGRACASDSPLLVKPGQRVDLSGETKFPESSASGGASSGGGHGPATSDLGSVEKQMGSHFQGVPIHGSKSDLSAAETSNRVFGRKRSHPESIFMGMPTDRIPQIGAESLENFHLMKMLRSSAVGERSRRSNDEEFSFGVQPNPNSTSNHILQPPGDRSDCVASRWDRSMLNDGPSVQYPSRFGQFATYIDKASSRDSNAGPSNISPPAADEGSRTGIKGSGILSAINAGNGNERSTPGVPSSSHRPKSGTQCSDPELSEPARQAGNSSASRQMTIFYGGQAHVFDEVHPNKADVIMSLAGSNGASWSTSYSPNSSVPSREKCSGSGSGSGSGLAFPRDLQRKLSIPRSSVHGYNQAGNNSNTSTAAGDRFNTISGSMTPKLTRCLNQQAEANTERKREG